MQGRDVVCILMDMWHMVERKSAPNHNWKILIMVEHCQMHKDFRLCVSHDC